MNVVKEDKFYIVRWKKIDKNPGIGIDVLTEDQYTKFQDKVELIKVNNGYEPTIKLIGASSKRGKNPYGFCS